jgi:hypothetical protein
VNDDVFLEVLLEWMMRVYMLALHVRKVMIGDTEHVHLDVGGDERDRRALRM